MQNHIRSYFSKAVLIGILFFSLTNSFAQIKADSVLKLNQFKIGVKTIGPTLSYERKLTNNFTLFTDASIIYGKASAVYITYDPSASPFDQFKYEAVHESIWTPTLGVEVRRYYAFEERAKKKKKTGNNSFNYISAGINYGFEPKVSNEAFNPGYLFDLKTTFGVQRMVGKKLSFDLQLGVAYSQYSLIKDRVVPYGDIKFGYVLK